MTGQIHFLAKHLKGVAHLRAIPTNNTSIKSRSVGTNHAGFTLIELLVSITILILIFAVGAVLTSTTQNTFNSGMDKLDADGQARLALDRMAMDMAAMLKRTDIDYIVKDSNQLQLGNDSIAFYVSTSGYYPSYPDAAPRKSMALVGYRVNQRYELERLAEGIGWTTHTGANGMTFLPSTLWGTWPSIAGAGAGGLANLNLGTDPDYQVLADGVFRFEYCYILRDGTYSNIPYLAPHTALGGWQDIVALYVAVGVLDNRSRAPVPKDSFGNPLLGTLASSLTDFQFGVGSSSPPIASWETTVNAPNFASTASLLPIVAKGVRVFARTIPINNTFPNVSP